MTTAGLFAGGAADRLERGTAPNVSSPLWLMRVPPLPDDLRDGTPSPSPPRTGDLDAGGGELSPAGEVAAAWVAAVYTARFDDPPGTAARYLAPLAASAEVAATAAASLTSPSPDAGEARWPVITEITATGDGWWRVELLVKTTRFGQAGPSTAATAVRVHVTGDRRVDRWAVVDR